MRLQVFLGGGASYLLGGYSACSWIGGYVGKAEGCFLGGGRGCLPHWETVF